MKNIALFMSLIIITSCDINFPYDIEKLVVRDSKIKLDKSVVMIPITESNKYHDHIVYDGRTVKRGGSYKLFNLIRAEFMHRISKKTRVNRGIEFTFYLAVHDKVNVSQFHKSVVDDFRVDTKNAFLAVNGINKKLSVSGDLLVGNREFFRYNEENTRPYTVSVLGPTSYLLGNIRNKREKLGYRVLMYVNFGDIEENDKNINLYLPVRLNKVDIVIEYAFDVEFERVEPEELITFGIPGGSP